MLKYSYDGVLRALDEAGANLRCDDLKNMLEGLGFKVVPCKAGHHTYSHPRIPNFHGSNFNCGHGKNPQLKRVYVRSVRKALKAWEDELKHLGY